MTNNIVGAIEAPPFKAVDQRRDIAILIGAADEVSFAFTMNQMAVQIKGHTVAAIGFAHHFRRFPQLQAI